MSNDDPTRPLSTGRGPQVEASAHGRVNLLGDHADLHDGFALSVAIPLATRLVLAARSDDSVNIGSTREPQRSYKLGHEQRCGGWLDYVQGVTSSLRAAGHELGGFDAHVTSEVPMAAGLASSAAFSVALLRALRLAFALKIGDLELAQLAQAGERDFVGVPVGIMDPLIVSLGQAGHALFIDTRTLDTRPVPFPDELALVAIHAGVPPAQDGADYRQRRDEYQQAAAALPLRSPRDVAPDALASTGLPSRLDRRALNARSEDQRVLDAVEALRSCDRAQLARLFLESHEARRAEHEESSKELDMLVSIAREQREIVAARITDAGMLLCLAERASVALVAERIATLYGEDALFTPRVLLPPT